MSEEIKSEIKQDNQIFKNGFKLIGERFLPGASLLMDGKIVEGGLHAVAGLGAGLIFGLPGMFLLAANSYSKSVTGKNLLEHVTDLTGSSKSAPCIDKNKKGKVEK